MFNYHSFPCSPGMENLTNSVSVNSLVSNFCHSLTDSVRGVMNVGPGGEPLSGCGQRMGGNFAEMRAKSSSYLESSDEESSISGHESDCEDNAHSAVNDSVPDKPLPNKLDLGNPQTAAKPNRIRENRMCSNLAKVVDYSANSPLDLMKNPFSADVQCNQPLNLTAKAQKSSQNKRPQNGGDRANQTGDNLDAIVQHALANVRNPGPGECR